MSKPGAVSTPVKHVDDHTPKAVEEVTVEKHEKQTPTLPGKHNRKAFTARAQQLSAFAEDFKDPSIVHNVSSSLYTLKLFLIW